MSTILGVALLTAPTSSVVEKLTPLGVTVTGPLDSQRGVFIRWNGSDFRVTEELAARVSTAAAATCFSVLAQTSADVYVVSEYEAGTLVRQISFDNGGGWHPPTGTERPWKTDFHFALPLSEFLDRVSDGV